MKRNLLTCVWIGLLLCAVGIMTVQAAITNAYITFSVDMSSNLVAGTFNPAVPAIIGGNSYGGTGTDTVYARGIFNGWANTGLQLFQVGTSGVYTNTADDTAAQDLSDDNANWQYDAYLNGTLTDEGSSDYANRMAYLPTTNNGSVVVPTGYFNDSGPLTTNNITYQIDMSEQIELGAFHPSSGDYVVVAGSYDNFVLGSSTPPQVVLTNNPNIVITNNNFSPPVIESNVWEGTGAISTDSSRALATVGCGQQFKYVIEPEGNWDAPQFPNLDPDGGNRFLTMTGDQTLPLVNFSDVPYAPVANVTLNLDMSGPIRYDPNYVTNSVAAWGSFNGWASGVTMTNNPSAPNPNLYSATITMGEGASLILQYRYTNSAVAASGITGSTVSGNNPWVYDYADDGVYSGNRRTITLPITPTPLTTNLPAVFFNDLPLDDVLPTATPVRFSVDMNGAVGTDAHVFNPSSDSVYINGSFAYGGGYPQYFYTWAGGVTPVAAPPGYQMVEVGSTTIYTNTILVPAGTPVALIYQYGMDVGDLNGGPLEDEAVAGANHTRVVRATGFNPYVMPTDAFTNQPYVEPFFSAGNIFGLGSLAGGNLMVGPATAGKIPVSWLGRPGAHLQSKTNLVSGLWTDYPNTDGTNWTAGSSTTNGFMSTTNWPSNGNTFFRLVKP
jgi:hypothetical protein